MVRDSIAWTSVLRTSAIALLIFSTVTLHSSFNSRTCSVISAFITEPCMFPVDPGQVRKKKKIGLERKKIKIFFSQTHAADCMRQTAKIGVSYETSSVLV